jgi:guanylate kinase
VPEGKLVIISGSSGVGKTSITEEITKQTHIKKFATCTTRQKRPNEIDGYHYHFLSEEEFLKLIEQNKLIEYTESYGNYYGIPAELLDELAHGRTLIIEVDFHAIGPLSQHKIEKVSIFILPPDIDELLKRLEKRATESPDQIEKRLQRISEEINSIWQYDMTIINDDLELTIKEIKAYLKFRGLLV